MATVLAAAREAGIYVPRQCVYKVRARAQLQQRALSRTGPRRESWTRGENDGAITAMPKKPKTARKKSPSTKKSDAPKVNKSAWIREQPATTPAKDLVKQAKAAGIGVAYLQ